MLTINRDLTVGFARAAITDAWRHPREGRTIDEYTVHDDLYATALVVCEDRVSAAAFVTLDLCVIPRPACDELRERIAKLTEIPADRIALHSTHTHASYSGYDVDPDVMAEPIANAVKAAAAAARPAHVAHAHRELGRGYNFNRRVHLSDGLGAWCVMFNTDCRTEGGRVEASGQIEKQVKNWEARWEDLEMSKRETWTDGPIDSHLHVLSFRDADGRTLGSVVRFAGHPVIVSRAWIGRQLSRDAVGYVVDVVAKATGAPCLYLTGPSGNQRLYCEEYSHAEAEKRGTLIGNQALLLLDGLKFAPLARFTLATADVKLALWPGFPVDRAEQEKRFAEACEKVKAAIADGRPTAEIKKLDEAATRVRFVGQMFDRPLLTAKESRAGVTRQPVMAWDFGPAALAGFPCEPFMEVSEGLRERFGERILTAQLVNGAHGYVPSAEEYPLGGYETTWCSTAADTAARYVDAAAALVKRAE